MDGTPGGFAGSPFVSLFSVAMDDIFGVWVLGFEVAGGMCELRVFRGGSYVSLGLFSQTSDKILV